MSETVTQPALKGIAVSSNAANGPLLIVEGKKQGKSIVMTLISLNNGEKQSEALASGTAFSGVFEGVSVKKGNDGYPDRSYLMIRRSDNSLVKINMSSSLQRDLDSAKAAGLLQGDAIEVTFEGTTKLENGRTFHKYSVNI